MCVGAGRSRMNCALRNVLENELSQKHTKWAPNSPHTVPIQYPDSTHDSSHLEFPKEFYKKHEIYKK